MFEELLQRIHRLEAIVAVGALRIAELEAENAYLRSLLNKNSSNSSKPPSSDVPDNIMVHPVEECANCQASLHGVPAAGFSDRQVFDIPPLKIHVTEHRTEFKICPDCAARTEALFPEDVTQPIQYGSNIKGLIVPKPDDS